MVLRGAQILVILAGMAAAMPATLFGQGEHARRAGSELLVLLGDIDRLQRMDPDVQQARGLHDRIAGMLSGLPLLLRLADQETERVNTASDIQRLRSLLVDRQWALLAEAVAALSSRYPLQSNTFLTQVSPVRLRSALHHHQSLCAACHDFPHQQSERPPFNLYQQAKQLPKVEFTARMLVGIRGDVMSGLGNPFTDEEIAALIALYLNAQSSAEADLRLAE